MSPFLIYFIVVAILGALFLEFMVREVGVPLRLILIEATTLAALIIGFAGFMALMIGYSA